MEKRKIILAWLMGCASFIGVLYSTQIAFNDFSINFPWGLIMPMVITLAWGLPYGLTSLIAGGVILYPFFLGTYNGLASFVPALSAFLWIFLQGWGARKRTLSTSVFYHIYSLQALYSVLRLILYMSLFPLLIHMNAALQIENMLTAVTWDVILIFAIKGIVVETIFLAIADALLYLPFVRKLLGLRIRAGSHRNTLILTGMVAGGLFFATMLLFLQQVVVPGAPISAWMSMEDDITVITLVMSGVVFVMAGGIVVRYVERTLASKALLKEQQMQLYRAHEELEMRVKERTRQLEEAVLDLESFTHTVSHDLKSPLRALSVYADMLVKSSRDVLKAEDAELLEEMQGQINEMIALVGHLLRYATMSREPLRLEMVDLGEIIQKVFERLSCVDSKRAVDLMLPPSPVLICADRMLIQQVVQNLIDNALKFTRTSEAPQIAIESKMDKMGVQVIFKDNGAGFDPVSASQLFSLFGRGHRQEVFEGYGVGLATVKKIMERHGGSVSIENNQDAGVSVTLVFPERDGEKRCTAQ